MVAACRPLQSYLHVPPLPQPTAGRSRTSPPPSGAESRSAKFSEGEGKDREGLRGGLSEGGGGGGRPLPGSPRPSSPRAAPRGPGGAVRGAAPGPRPAPPGTLGSAGRGRTARTHGSLGAQPSSARAAGERGAARVGGSGVRAARSAEGPEQDDRCGGAGSPAEGAVAAGAQDRRDPGAAHTRGRWSRGCPRGRRATSRATARPLGPLFRSAGGARAAWTRPRAPRPRPGGDHFHKVFLKGLTVAVSALG